MPIFSKPSSDFRFVDGKKMEFVSQSLDRGFDSTEHFSAYSLSVQNRRKSRAGLALENHVEAIFQEYGIRFTRAATTEGKSKPDFIFPSQREYFDP